jgi:hypothetical protein
MKKISYGYQLTKSVVDETRKGQLGICVVALTSCDNKLLASGRHYIGRIQKATIITNARLGVKYENMVSVKGDGSAFVPSKPNGMTWIEYPYFKQADRSGKIYLSINYRECDERTKFKSVYLLDGEVATDEDVERFEAYFKGGSSYSKKQAAAGVVNEHEQTKVVQYDVNDIAYIGTDKKAAEDRFEYIIS